MRKIYPVCVSLFVSFQKKGEREQEAPIEANQLRFWVGNWTALMACFSFPLTHHYLWKWTFLWSFPPNSSSSSLHEVAAVQGKKWHEVTDSGIKAICFAKVPSEQHCHFNNSRSRDCFPRFFQSSFLIHGRIRGTLKTIRLGGLQIIKMKVTARWLLLGKRVMSEGCLVRKKGPFQSAL